MRVWPERTREKDEGERLQLGPPTGQTDSLLWGRSLHPHPHPPPAPLAAHPAPPSVPRRRRSGPGFARLRPALGGVEVRRGGGGGEPRVAAAAAAGEGDAAAARPGSGRRAARRQEPKPARRGPGLSPFPQPAPRARGRGERAPRPPARPGCPAELAGRDRCAHGPPRPTPALALPPAHSRLRGPEVSAPGRLLAGGPGAALSRGGRVCRHAAGGQNCWPGWPGQVL